MSASLESRPLLPHPTPDPAWLPRRSEPIIEPDRAIVDPHHHLWDRNGRYFLDDLLGDTGSGHRIVSTVFVQCAYGYRSDGPAAMRPVGETEFVLGVAREAERRETATRVCEGIVSHADLLLGDAVDAVLDAHREASAGRLRGIRHITARDDGFLTGTAPMAPAGIMADRTFREGFARLAGHDLSFDAWLFHPQIDELTDLARAFPETSIVIDHVGGPLGVGPYAGQRDAVFAVWGAAMRRLAACPNVTVKLGGMAMQISGLDLHTQALPPTSAQLAGHWRPYVETCIEAFGADRCMFESNFPVDKGMCSYAALWNAFKLIARGASDDEKAALFQRTAARVYRLRA